MAKIVRRLVRPVSRPAMLFLFWTRRHTLRLWFTSIKTELAGGAFEWPRFKTLVQALFRLSSDPKVGNSPKVRSLRVVGDVIEVDADPNWTKLPILRSTLTDVAAVSRVDLAPGPLGAAAQPTSHRVENLYVDDLTVSR